MSELKQKSTSRSQSRDKKSSKNKKRTVKSTKNHKPSKDKSIEDSISSLIDQFDSLFIEKDSNFDKKKIKEFARNTLIMKDKNVKGEKVKKRLEHLRKIEIERQKAWKENHIFEVDAEENWKDNFF